MEEPAVPATTMLPLENEMGDCPKVELPVNSGTVFVVPPDVVTVVWPSTATAQNTSPSKTTLDSSIETLRLFLFPIIERCSFSPNVNLV
jgi:hypothetical protein